MKTGDSPPIFISYKSDDVDFVRPICERLIADGHSTWFNEYDVPYDRVDEFQRFINRGIDEAAWGLVFANDRYARSPYCALEVERLLRRLPVERLFVFQDTEHSVFEADYPELRARRFVIREQHEVLDHLLEAGVISRIAPPGVTAPSSPLAEWWLKEIGARFNPSLWRPDPGSIWPEWEMSDITGEPRSDPNVFVADLDGKRVRLLVDYRLLEANLATSLRQRTVESADGTIRFLDDEQDDRQRLREELQYFGREVATVQDVARSRRAAGAPDTAGTEAAFEPIGVHVFNTVESLDGVRNAYKHRLFSYRLSERVYRVYKLGLPQPQLGAAVAVRFIFRFEDDRRAFFHALPVCDAVVRSFSWLSLATRPRLGLADVRQAAQRARGDPS